MKRLLSLLTLSLMFVLGVQAQETIIEVDEKGLTKKLLKSDEAIANPKKNGKASVWFERGELLREIANAPTKGLYIGLTKAKVLATFEDGEPAGKKEVKDKEYDVIAYPYFDAYILNDTLAFWSVKKQIKEDAMVEAVNAYSKAVELDPALSTKVNESLFAIANLYKEKGGSFFSNLNFTEAAKMFRGSYDVGLHPVLNVIDTVSVFNAGYLNTIALAYEPAIKDFKEALKYGCDKNGETYYYIFHCYYGLNDTINARDILEEGFAKYPSNNNIMEGLLSLYTSVGEDPNKVLPLVLRAIENYPTNASLWSGLGSIYEKLNKPDESLQAFIKAAELAPNDYGAQFNLGLLYVRKGDIIGDELNKKEFTSQDDYDSSFKVVFDLYLQGLAPLEKAVELKPGDVAVLKLLKSITFRIRDQKGQEGKYDKYSTMLDKALQK